MLHPDGVRHALVHHDQVEPILVIRPPVTLHPDHGHLRLGTALTKSQRFQRGAEPVGAPGLDLHERHLPTPADDEINVVVPQPKAPIQDTPAARFQKGDRRLLALVTEHVAGVGPLAHGFGLISGRHGLKMAHAPAKLVTGTTRNGLEKLRGAALAWEWPGLWRFPADFLP